MPRKTESPTPSIEVEHVYNPDAVEGHRAHMASLRLLVEIMISNDAAYGVPEKVDTPDVA